MSTPTPPADPRPEGEPDEVEAPEVPLNRAARRANAKKKGPSHVGPQAGRTGEGRTPRSHTKRQI